MKRILAIDPITRGFGFAVLEGPDVLVDWGLKGTSQWHESRNAWCLRQVGDLIDFYQPDAVVLEEHADPHSRRCSRIRHLLDGITEVARARGIKARRIPKRRLGRVFSPGRATKYKAALAIAGRFPELVVRLPPIRKPWMSEDARMGIFDAVALALAFFGRERIRSPAA
jgi:hypothetical protein